MTQKIGDILEKSSFDVPNELAVIRSFLAEHYQATAKIHVNQHQIVIGVSSAALAGTLRMRLHELQKLCQTEKRLIIRIN